MMISVAMATYNGEKYLEKQLLSIFNQTILPNEIVIVDDCSTDKTVQLIQSLSHKTNIILRIYTNEYNLGYKKNFYNALSYCKGDYIFLCDQDDEWEYNKIEILLKLMEKKSISVLSSSFSLIDQNSKDIFIKKKFGFSNQNFYKRRVKNNELVKVPLEDLLFHNMSQGCSLVITNQVRKTFLEYFDDTIPHDWQLNIIGAMNDATYFYNKKLFKYRLHENNTIGYGINNIGINEKMSLKVRVMTVKDCVMICNYVSKIDGSYILNHKSILKLMNFSKKHIEYLSDLRIIKLILQNFNPRYFRIKSFKGRIADILYVIVNKFK